MGTQLERFIEITRDNYCHLIKLWDNVEEREIKGNGDVEVSLGVDFKKRAKNRHKGEALKDTNNLSGAPSPAKSQTVPVETSETVNLSQPRKVAPQAPKNLFQDDSSSEDDEDLVS